MFKENSNAQATIKRINKELALILLKAYRIKSNQTTNESMDANTTLSALFVKGKM